MSKVLTAYFSASGVTADAAKKIAEAAGADLCEIRPEVLYSPADLNWQDPGSRSSVEMKDPAARPAMAAGEASVADYDVVFLGFPIWWGTAPRIISTFLESADFSGKRIILFATSGGSGFGTSQADLKRCVSDQVIIEEGMLVHGTEDADTWKAWVESLGI